MKQISGRIKIVVTALGVVTLAVLLLLVVVPRVAGGALHIQLGEAASPTAGSPDSEPAHERAPAIPVSLGERVVNLGDPGGYRYIKVEIVLSLYDDDIDTSGMDAGELEDAQAEALAQLQPLMPQIQDVVTMVLTAQMVADVSTPAGKESVKAQLIERLAPILTQQHIDAIYFAQFLIQ